MSQDFTPNKKEAADLIRQFRGSYTNFYMLWKRGEKAPKGVQVYTPEEYGLSEEKLSTGLRSQLAAYREAHPKEGISLVKYMQVREGRPQLVVEDERELPEDRQLSTLSQTTTLVTNDVVQVMTEIVVAERS